MCDGEKPLGYIGVKHLLDNTTIDANPVLQIDTYERDITAILHITVKYFIIVGIYLVGRDNDTLQRVGTLCLC